ncbi:MAG: endonuclease III domain-containing protein [bacterium]|nr:endonuclease III domain-containing protein [bacterium]
MNINFLYQALHKHFGNTGWWPGDSYYEYFIGCILAQNTRWERVVPVIERMKQRDILSPEKYLTLGKDALEEVLAGSGTYRRKAEYLRIAGKYMLSIGWKGTPGSVRNDTSSLRNELLALKGIGPETCDCILLYVLERPVFVVDAYTRRILSRHNLCRSAASYDDIQKVFYSNLIPDVDLFKEYHALIVKCAKEFCKPAPKCEGCPLNGGGKQYDN